jgi:hypothetical protein
VKYAHSDNEEVFRSGEYDTLEQALADALDEYDDGAFWVCEVEKRTIGEYLDTHDVESILERLAEQAGEECGEVAEDWLSGPPSPQRAYLVAGLEPAEEYNAKVIKWRQDKAEWLAPLVDGFRAVLEAWATEHGEQPGFWHAENSRQYTREEAEAITLVRDRGAELMAEAEKIFVASSPLTFLDQKDLVRDAVFPGLLLDDDVALGPDAWCAIQGSREGVTIYPPADLPEPATEHRLDPDETDDHSRLKYRNPGPAGRPKHHRKAWKMRKASKQRNRRKR